MKFSDFELNSAARYVLGIDQSVTHTGLTLIDKEKEEILISFGVATHPENCLEERYLKIKEEIRGVLLKYRQDELVVYIEGLAYSGGNSNNRAILFGLFAVILNFLYENNYPYKIIPPKTLKKLFTGNGNATKQDMLDTLEYNTKERLKELSNLKEKSKKFEDIVDSYALAFVGVNQLKTVKK